MNRVRCITILLACWLSMPTGLFAQSSLDSLQRELGNTQEQGDSVQVAMLYITMASLTTDEGDLQGALNYYELADSWNPPDNSSIQTIVATQRSLIWQKLGLVDSAMNQLEETIVQAGPNPSPDILPTYSALGDILRTAGNEDKAMQYWQDGLSLARDLQDTLWVIDLQSELARQYREMGLYPQALSFYLNCLTLSIALGDTHQQAATYNRIGVLFYYQKKYTLARSYYWRAFHLHLTHNNLRGQTQIYNNIALLHLESGILDSATWYYQRALPMAKKIRFTNGLGWIYYGLARVSLEKGDFPTALKYAYQSVEFRRDRKFLLAQSYLTLGNIHRRNNTLDSALHYYSEAHLLSLEVQDASNYGTSLEGLSWTYQHLKQYDTALILFQQYKIMADSLNNEESTRQQTLMAAEYQFQMERDSLAQEQRLSEQAHDQELAQRKFLLVLTLVGILGLGILVLVVGNAYRQKNLAHEELGQLHEEVAAQRDHLDKALLTKDRFFSIISHDLRGPINSFGSLAYLLKDSFVRGKTEDLPALLDALETNSKGVSQLLDNLLSWALQQQGLLAFNPARINLAILAKRVVDIFDLQAKSKEIALLETIPNELEVYADENALYTILRNLVSNALKFTLKGGQITLEALQTPHDIQVRVTDNGIGMDQEKLALLFELDKKKVTRGTAGEKGTGLGLSLVKEFIESMGGTILVESTLGEGSTFTITLPLPPPSEISNP